MPLEHTINTTIPHKVIERVERQRKAIHDADCLKSKCPSTIPDEQQPDLEFLLQHNMPYQCYLRFLDKHEDAHWRASFILTSDSDYQLGKVIISELSCHAHGRAISIVNAIRNAIQAAAYYTDIKNHIKLKDILLHINGSTTTRWSNGDSREPDNGLCPSGRRDASLNIEVAFSQSVKLLQEKTQGWINYSNTAIAIAIKIYPGHRERLTLFYYDINQRKEQIEFGEKEDTAQVLIPLDLLYHGVAVPQAIAHLTNIVIDLTKIRDDIYEVFGE